MQARFLILLLGFSAAAFAVDAAPVTDAALQPTASGETPVETKASAGDHPAAAIAAKRGGRGHARGSHHRGRAHVGVHDNGYRGPRVYGGWYGGYWGPWYGYGPVVYYDHRRDRDFGAVDINIHPKKTKVYLNGSLIGKVSKFDGFPGYLWLKQGKYEVIYHLEGHETVRKIYHVTPGVVIKENMDMVSGEAVAPAKLSNPPEPPVYVRRRDSDVRGDQSGEGVPERRYVRRQSRVESDRDGALDVRAEPARLGLDIAPGDASVYLDGQFISTARDLAKRGGFLTVDPGKHWVEVVRPGYAPAQLEVDLAPGARESLTVDLDKN